MIVITVKKDQKMKKITLFLLVLLICQPNLMFDKKKKKPTEIIILYLNLYMFPFYLYNMFFYRFYKNTELRVLFTPGKKLLFSLKEKKDIILMI